MLRQRPLRPLRGETGVTDYTEPRIPQFDLSVSFWSAVGTLLSMRFCLTGRKLVPGGGSFLIRM